jgi:hypothetical protein
MRDNGDPPAYRARPAFLQPVDHAADANSGESADFLMVMLRVPAAGTDMMMDG